MVIYILIGRKGSGKSFIGEIMEEEYGIKFIRVEDWAKQIKKDRQIDNEIYLKEVFESIEIGIRESTNQNERIVFESTGLTEYFDKMWKNLKKDFQVTTIKIEADKDLCLERVKRRDQRIHINVSDNQVRQINDQVEKKVLETNYRIENSNKSKEEIIKELEEIFKK